MLTKIKMIAVGVALVAVAGCSSPHVVTTGDLYNPIATVDRIEDNNQVVLEIVAGGDVYVVDVGACDFADAWGSPVDNMQVNIVGSPGQVIDVYNGRYIIEVQNTDGVFCWHTSEDYVSPDLSLGDTCTVLHGDSCYLFAF